MTDLQNEPSTAAGAQVKPTENAFTKRLSHVLGDLGKNGIFIALIVVVLLFEVIVYGLAVPVMIVPGSLTPEAIDRLS